MQDEDEKEAEALPVLLLAKRKNLRQLTHAGVGVIGEEADKDNLLNTACILAEQRGSAVYVYNDTGQLEAMFAYPRSQR